MVTTIGAVSADGSVSSVAGGSGPPITVRRAGDEDEPAILQLCGAALGWHGDARDQALFRWKHRNNPFGASPTWVAESDGQVVAVRVFLRWDFVRPDGSVVRAVRAVDTATLPAFQGRGLFRQLTTTAVAELTTGDDDVGSIAFVFNTPNDQSRPGYLTMGWEVVGRVPMAVAIGGVRGLLRLPGARRPAGKWSLPTSAGLSADEVLGDSSAIDALVVAAGPTTGLGTRRSADFLRWRYADGPVTYRALRLGRDASEGVAVFRQRKRGSSIEADVVDLLVPDDDAARRRRALVAAVAKATKPDHLLVAQHARRSGRAWRADRLGPLLTWRAVTETVRPPVADWSLALGDIELF